jgi:hypothetical protein
MLKKAEEFYGYKLRSGECIAQYLQKSVLKGQDMGCAKIPIISRFVSKKSAKIPKKAENILQYLNRVI